MSYRDYDEMARAMNAAKVAKVRVRITLCSLCRRMIPAGEGVRHPNDRHYMVHKGCGIEKHGEKRINEWIRCWQIKELKKDERWLRDIARDYFAADRMEQLGISKNKYKLCEWCGLGIEVDTPWEHKQIMRHPAVIRGEGKWAFLFYADSTARWVKVSRRIVNRWRFRWKLQGFRHDIWPWVKLLTLGAVLVVIWGFVCIHLEPVVDLEQTPWWMIHQMQAEFGSLYDSLVFLAIRAGVFVLNASWFIFWTWMFLGNEALKSLMRNLSQQCDRN